MLIDEAKELCQNRQKACFNLCVLSISVNNLTSQTRASNFISDYKKFKPHTQYQSNKSKLNEVNKVDAQLRVQSSKLLDYASRPTGKQTNYSTNVQVPCRRVKNLNIYIKALLRYTFFSLRVRYRKSNTQLSVCNICRLDR